MKYVDEYRDPGIARALAEKIHQKKIKDITDELSAGVSASEKDESEAKAKLDALRKKAADEKGKLGGPGSSDDGNDEGQGPDGRCGGPRTHEEELRASRVRAAKASAFI